MSSPTLDSSAGQTRWGLVVGVVLAGFVIGELAATLLASIAASLAHYPGGLSALSHAAQSPWWFSAMSLVGLWCGFAWAARTARVRAGLEPLTDQWRLRASDAIYVVLGVALQFAITLAYLPWHVQHLNQPVNRLLGGVSGAGTALIVLLTVVGAPVMEEVFFRGVLFRGLAGLLRAGDRGGRLWLAALLSGVLFALAHGERAQFVGLAAVGVVLALLVARTRRLTPSVLTHASFNAVALGALYVPRGH